MSKELFLRKVLDQAAHEAYSEVENRVRLIMKQHKNVASFCMGMGTYMFSDKGGNIMDDNTKYFKPVIDFIGEFDSALRITGMPMKIKGFDGPLLTDW